MTRLSLYCEPFNLKNGWCLKQVILHILFRVITMRDKLFVDLKIQGVAEMYTLGYITFLEMYNNIAPNWLKSSFWTVTFIYLRKIYVPKLETIQSLHVCPGIYQEVISLRYTPNVRPLSDTLSWQYLRWSLWDLLSIQKHLEVRYMSNIIVKCSQIPWIAIHKKDWESTPVFTVSKNFWTLHWLIELFYFANDLCGNILRIYFA